MSVHAQASSQVRHSSGRQSSAASYPQASAWNIPGNASVSDGTYASSVALLLSSTSQYLVTTEYDFDIPASATVTGIEVNIEKFAFGVLQAVKDYEVRLTRNGAISGINKAKSTTWPFSRQNFSYGSPTDKWGHTLTPATVNASDFGVVISAYLYGLFVIPIAYIDEISITVHYIEAPLPIELISFEGERMSAEQVTFEWKTASEVSNDFFSIERLGEDFDWEVKTEVQGVGNSSAMQDYSVEIEDRSKETSYYRLTQHDFDGQVEHFPPIAIGPSKTSSSLVDIYPNPVNSGRLFIRSDRAILQIRILDPLGSEVLRIDVTKESPLLSQVVDLTDLESGNYLLEAITIDHKREIKKLFVE